MRHIKAKFRLPQPASDDYDVYGWETLWTKKTQMIEGQAIEAGSIVDFQPMRVRRDGKFLALATEKNVRMLKAMLDKRQVSLAPGETLEVEGAQARRPAEESWPDEPALETPHAEAEEDYAVSEAPAKPKRRSRKPEDMTPDVEG